MGRGIRSKGTGSIPDEEDQNIINIFIVKMCMEQSTKWRRYGKRNAPEWQKQAVQQGIMPTG